MYMASSFFMEGRQAMAAIDYISGEVEKLAQKHMTRDPFELCRDLGVKIRYKDLGEHIKAYYFCESRIRNIVLNNRISRIIQRVLVAHELGHDRLHSEIAALKSYKVVEPFRLTIPTEYEANLFAADLLIDDDELLDLLDYDDRTLYGIASELYVPYPLLEFKLRILQHKGYDVNAPWLASGDYLKNKIAGCFEEE
jgi:Zn-dependent peptidase ImmA (M78 family)